MSYELTLPRASVAGQILQRVTWPRLLAGLTVAALMAYAIVVPLVNVVPLTDVAYQTGA